MKKGITLSFLIIILFSTLSCKKIIDQLFSPIDVDIPAFQVVIPLIPLVTPNEISLGSITFYFNLDSIIKSKTSGVFSLSAVSTIRVKQMSINIQGADQSNNFSNFESARFYLSSGNNNNPAEIATFTFPDTFSSLASSVPSNSPELKDYFSGNELTYTLFGKIRKPTSKALTALVNITLSVK